MIKLTHVRKEFGKKVAVDDLTLEIPSGELFAFLGPNGAGKTTTIKMVAGLLRPTRGTIEVCGMDISKDYVAAKKIMAYVPDQPFLYDKLSGSEFLNFIGDMYGMDNGVVRAKEIDRLVELFGMGEWIEGLTETYSHGMKQRVVLAATLLHRPKVMVVDEPLVGLDPHTARQVKGIFAEEAKKGTTIFLTTHVLSIAEETADRIGIILDGRLRAVGTLDELRKQADSKGGDLEEIFFRITEREDASRVAGERKPEGGAGA